MLFEVLKNYRIGITGDSGFLGKHLCNKLESLGCSIIKFPHEKYDLLDYISTKQWFIDHRPEIIFNLAAKVGGIITNSKHSGEFFYQNLLMGMNLIELSRIYKVKKFIQVGTVCSYPKYTKVPFKEEDIWNGYPEETNSGYGIAKKALLTMLQKYREQYGFNGIYLLPSNLYGPYDNFDLETSHVIPALIKKISSLDEGEVLHCWGTGSSTRDFLYVEDCAEALILAAIYYNGAEPINIGTGVETSILELINKLFHFFGRIHPIEWNGKLDGQPRRVLDTSKAKNAFGFVALTSLDDGLKKTIEWYINEKISDKIERKKIWPKNKI